MQNSSVFEVLDLVKEKKNLLDEMFSLTEKQSKLIKDEKFENLEDVLDEKDHIIERINRIDLKSKRIIQDTKIKNKELSRIVLEIEEILIKIKTLDDENNRKISAVMNDMKIGIKGIRQSVRAMKSYGNSDPYESFAALGGTLFIDQDS